VLEVAARVLRQCRELDRAEALARQLVTMEPDNGSAFGRLTWILTERGKLRRGHRIARQAIRARPEQLRRLGQPGYAALEKKDLAQAEEATRQALRLKPGLASATTNLVAVLREKGAAEEAAEVLSRALAREPGNTGWRRQLDELRTQLAARDRMRWSDAVALTVASSLVAVAVAVVNGWAGIAVGLVLLAITAWLWLGPRRAKPSR
jgi:tetratricopeptide (TPR) repeat protein